MAVWSESGYWRLRPVVTTTIRSNMTRPAQTCSKYPTVIGFCGPSCSGLTRMSILINLDYKGCRRSWDPTRFKYVLLRCFLKPIFQAYNPGSQEIDQLNQQKTIPIPRFTHQKWAENGSSFLDVFTPASTGCFPVLQESTVQDRQSCKKWSRRIRPILQFWAFY